MNSPEAAAAERRNMNLSRAVSAIVWRPLFRSILPNLY